MSIRNANQQPTNEVASQLITSDNPVVMSRRSVLKGMGAIFALTVGGVLLEACGSDTPPNVICNNDCDCDIPEESLDGELCTPEGSGITEEGDCSCEPVEGSCGGPGDCEDPCYRDYNNTCVRPYEWECF